MHNADLFDARLAAYKTHQATPWGRLFYTISRANLRRHLDGRPLRILDAGGGNGVEALHYAGQGHTVALLDLSPGMLADAASAAEREGIAGRMSFHQGDLAALPALFPEPCFDLVLCHNVLQYLDDLDGSLRALCHLLRPGGLLSIISVNRYSEPYRQALMSLDLDTALAGLDADTLHAGIFGVPVHARLAEDLYPPLEEAGCRVLARYGIRCVGDYIADNNLKYDPAFFACLERLELALTDRFPYYLLARFFHLIALKPA